MNVSFNLIYEACTNSFGTGDMPFSVRRVSYDILEIVYIASAEKNIL